MSDRRIPPNGFYVYILFREDGETPFYVGKGGFDRWLQHERAAHKRGSLKNDIILSMRAAGVLVVPKLKIAEGLTSRQAAELEVATIARIGRYPNGPLVNLTKGGEYISDLPEEILKRRNEGISRASLGKKKSAAHRESMSRTRKGRTVSAAHAAILRQAGKKNRGKLHSKEQTIGRTICKQLVALARAKARFGHVGVEHHRRKFRAIITVNYQKIIIGSFTTRSDAQHAYIAAVTARIANLEKLLQHELICGAIGE
jgi:hypothetical protein